MRSLEEPQDDCPNIFDWIDEKVVTRLQTPLKTILLFFDKEIKNMSVKEVAIKPSFYIVRCTLLRANYNTKIL